MTENTISDASLRGETSGHVQELSGFSRFHRSPEEHSPGARRFVQAAGGQDLAARAAMLFQSIRSGFRFKRKEIALACDGGAASIGTPDFDVVLTLEQDPKIAEHYRLLTEVSGFRREDIVNTPEFLAVFADCCDTVVVRFAKAIDLEEKIDRIEENDELARFLDYDSEYRWLALRLPHLLLEVTPLQMTCRLPGEANLGQLVARTQEALARFSAEGALLDG